MKKGRTRRVKNLIPDSRFVREQVWQPNEG
jgi:hypothetical protein